MPRSINDRQVNVKLEDLGDEKNTLKAISLDSVEKALIEMATLFKVTAENELSIQNAIDTGKLGNSIQFENVKFLGGLYSVDIKVLDYYKFVNSGVAGTRGGSSKEGFKFKNEFVSKDFMFAIRKWVIRHALASATTSAKPKYALGTEKKGASFSETSNAVAYAVARSIKRKGIKSTSFWDKAEKTTLKEMEQSLGNSFAVDIVNEIAKKK